MKQFKFLLKYSYRNLGRAPKRTLIMVLSLALGCGFIIWDLNFSRSGSKEMMKEFLTQYAGRFHITHKDYYKKNDKVFNNFKIISDADIEDFSGLEKSTRRVTAPVFVSGEKKTLGVLLSGIDVVQEEKVSTLHRAITVGRNLTALGEREIVLGKRLAERIDIKLGQEVAVVGQALDGSVANELMTVVGLLDFGGGDLEESLAFTQLATAQSFMVMEPEFYHQRVQFDMTNDHVPNLKNVAVTDWVQLLPEISVSVRFIDRFTWIVAVIIVLVISLGLANTLMITFLEREKEFQSLNILGAKASWVAKSLMIEVFIMGTLSVVLGALIGALATYICYIYPVNIALFTGGKPILMGGMLLQPLVRIYSVPQYYWQVPLLIYFFLGLTMIYPLMRVIRRSTHAI